MMRPIFRALVLTSLVANAATAQPTAGRRLGSDSLHRLLAGFLAQPFVNGPRFREILDSAEKSPHVTVAISSAVAPWMCELPGGELGNALKSVLLGAFVAGNMQVQLETGIKRDQPVAGARAALAVYERADRRGALLVPTMERWLELRRAGTLDSAIAVAAATRPAECRKP